MEIKESSRILGQTVDKSGNEIVIFDGGLPEHLEAKIIAVRARVNPAPSSPLLDNLLHRVSPEKTA